MSDIEPSPRRFPDIQLDTATPGPTTSEAEESAKTEAILSLARTRMRSAESALSFFREWSKRDQQFAIGTWGTKTYQWPDEIQNERQGDGRACLTINRTRGYVRMVSNTARQANLRIQVSPVDDRGDPKVAEIFQSVIRNIERTSFAEYQYAKASDVQAEQGLSFFRLTTEWADDTGFRQRIKLKAVRNPRRVIFDPAGIEEPDFSTCEYVFYVVDVDPDRYEAVTGTQAPESSQVAFANDVAEVNDWFPGGKRRIAHYYAVEREEYLLLELTDGRTVREPEWLEIVGAEVRRAAETDPTVDQSAKTIAETAALWRKNPERVRRTRTVRKKQWMHRVITATDILEESPWPGSSHALIPVIGEMFENPDTGEVDFRGVTRDTRDPAKAYNVEVTGLVEDIGLGHKSPVVGYKGQFGAEGSAQRTAWTNANRKPYAFLEVDPMPADDGRPAPLPIRNSYSPPIEATVLGIQQADNDLKATGGFHDASLGERGPQESRVAIAARQRQDEHGSSHYLFNLRMALACAGKQLIELIRVVYDVPQVIRITGDGDRVWKAMIYSGAERDPRREEFLESGPDGQPIPFQLPKGVDGIFDIGTGEYDVEVSPSPSPGTRRQETVGQMIEVMKVVPPPMAAVMAPKMVKKTDIPDALEISEAMARTLPPELQDDDKEGEDGEKIPPRVKAMLAQMKGQLDAATQAAQEAGDTVRTKRLELEARAQSDRLKAWLELVKLYVQEQNADRRLLLERQLEVAGRFLDLNVERMNAMQQQPPGAPAPPAPEMPPVDGGVP